MRCNNCFYEHAICIRSGFITDENGDRVNREVCERCGDASLAWVPDVYCNPHEVVETLHDRNGQPIVFVTKRQKARYLRERGLVEAGDKVRGGDMLDLPPVENKRSRDEVRREVKDAVERARAKLKGYNRA